MPSLLQKLSYFDPATGGTLVVSDNNFIWKEGKKSPEDSKVTRLVKKYGWKLVNGTDDSLTFRKNGDPGELFVERGTKKWSYRDPVGFIMKAVGLDRLYDALEKDVFGRFGKAASPATTAVNNAGNGHDTIDGDPLPEIHVSGSKLLQARETMHDDSGALTGLRSRPDYGESDSYTSEMNEANKSACLVLSGSVKTASGTKQAELYVASVEYERGCALKLASFQYSPDPMQAKVFGRRTAKNLVRQIRGLCGASAKIVKPTDLKLAKTPSTAVY